MMTSFSPLMRKVAAFFDKVAVGRLIRLAAGLAQHTQRDLRGRLAAAAC